MTYGWAILIVVVALAALAYFGVLNPPTPSKCLADTSTGLVCLSNAPSIDKNTGVVSIALQNAAGDSINITGVQALQGTCTVSGFTVKDKNGNDITNQWIPADSTLILGVNCGTAAQNPGRFKEKFKVTYTKQQTGAGFPQSSTVEVAGKIE